MNGVDLAVVGGLLLDDSFLFFNHPTLQPRFASTHNNHSNQESNDSSNQRTSHEEISGGVTNIAYRFQTSGFLCCRQSIESKFKKLLNTELIIEVLENIIWTCQLHLDQLPELIQVELSVAGYLDLQPCEVATHLDNIDC